jgi:hypothetical protein
MLAYFHYCNKGSHPFSMDWTNKVNITFAQLNPEQVIFMQEMREEIEQRSTSNPEVDHLSSIVVDFLTLGYR